MRGADRLVVAVEQVAEGVVERAAERPSTNVSKNHVVCARCHFAGLASGIDWIAWSSTSAARTRPPSAVARSCNARGGRAPSRRPHPAAPVPESEAHRENHRVRDGAHRQARTAYARGVRRGPPCQEGGRPCRATGWLARHALERRARSRSWRHRPRACSEEHPCGWSSNAWSLDSDEQSAPSETSSARVARCRVEVPPDRRCASYSTPGDARRGPKNRMLARITVSSPPLTSRRAARSRPHLSATRPRPPVT